MNVWVLHKALDVDFDYWVAQKVLLWAFWEILLLVHKADLVL